MIVLGLLKCCVGDIYDVTGADFNTDKHQKHPRIRLCLW